MQLPSAQGTHCTKQTSADLYHRFTEANTLFWEIISLNAQQSLNFCLLGWLC